MDEDGELTGIAERLGAPFARRYELQHAIGAGGMARVYRALDRELGRLVAIKVQEHDASFAEASRERFVFEAQAGARIHDANVVRAFEWGEGRECWWLACELVEGASVAQLMGAAGGILPVVRALELAVQVARGLSAIHDAGLVHRDLKPENLLVSDLDGVLKITDLGLATGAGRDFRTESGVVLGTPTFMAPEQVREKAGPASDLYALGTLLYVMISGHFPFPGTSDLEIVTRKVKQAGPSRRLAQLRPDVAGPIDELVAALLAREPADRPPGAREVAAELERLLELGRAGKLAPGSGSRGGAAGRGAAKEATPREVAGGAAAAAGREDGGSTGRRAGSRGAGDASAGKSGGSSRSRRRRELARGALAAGAGLILALALGGLWIWWARSGSAAYAAQVRVGEWGRAVQVVVPQSTGVPLKPARMVFPGGAPVESALDSGAVVFPVGIAHLSDLGPSGLAEVSGPEGSLERYAIAIDPRELESVRAAWDRQAMEVAAVAESVGGLATEGERDQNYDPVRFEGEEALPPSVTVLISRLEARLPSAFAHPYKGWQDLAAWMRSGAPLEQKLRLYRALARWESGAMAAGRLPRINPRKHPNDPPARDAHPLVSVLRALVEVRATFVHDSVWGPPDVVQGLTNAANIRWIRNLRHGRAVDFADLTGSMMLTELSKIMLQALPDGPHRERYVDRLAITRFECARLAGQKAVELEPERGSIDGAAIGRAGVRLAVIEFFPTSALRLKLPISAGPPLDLWLGHTDVREHRVACPEDCRAWKHTMVFTVLLPHGLRMDTAMGRIGLRQGPIVPVENGTRLPCEREESALTRIDIPESEYATMIISDAAWIVEP